MYGIKKTEKSRKRFKKMIEIVRCKRCNHILHNPESIKRGYGKTCYRIIQLQEKQPEKFDMKEVKTLITSEIQRVLKEFNFNRPMIYNNTENIEIIPTKIKKMPKFNIIEVNKRLIIKELKEQLQKGISNVLQQVGSFDEQINFYEPIGILA